MSRPGSHEHDTRRGRLEDEGMRSRTATGRAGGPRGDTS